MTVTQTNQPHHNPLKSAEYDCNVITAHINIAHDVENVEDFEEIYFVI